MKKEKYEVADIISSEANLFSEASEALECIHVIASTGETASDECLQRFVTILDRYLEFPTLLDPSLERMVTILCQRVLQEGESPHPSLAAIYALCKVRGYKTIQRFLTHTVEAVPIIWKLLQEEETPHWESTYVLWHWMGHLALVPFDGMQLMKQETGDWLESLLTACQQHFTDAGPTRQASAVCCAAWLSRPDTINRNSDWSTFLQNANEIFVAYPCKTETLSAHQVSLAILGVLQTITTILKTSSVDRSILVQRLAPLWEPLLKLSSSSSSLPLLLTKQLIKWWTRMSCVHLPPRASRRTGYNRNQKLNSATQNQAIEGLFLVPDLVEDAMGRILQALVTHSSTVVRWSAAKGVGRLAERLPSLCVEDVIDSLFDEAFGSSSTADSWHGGCLALAELARRGLIPSSRLSEVIPILVQAITYDTLHGKCSVGSHVRDGACYTYWALVRAYRVEELARFLPALSQAVVTTSLLDREINCRRAASAAFQEAVGRQGASSFPNGIAIITLADYVALGNRNDSYTTITWKIAECDEYRRGIVDHLFTVKLFHWDRAIRQLASKSLHGLVIKDEQYFCQTVIPYLLEKSLDMKSLEVRHGAVLGVGEIVLALSLNGRLASLPKEASSSVIGLPGTIDKKRMYRGRGGEIMRSAACRLVECISRANLPLKVKEQVVLLDIIDGCIPHPNETIQKDACAALHQLMTVYFPVGSQGPSDRLQARVVDKFLDLCQTSTNPAATRGYTMALGFLPNKLIAPNGNVLHRVLSCLVQSSHHDSIVGDSSDAETRRNALCSLCQLTQNVLLDEETATKLDRSEQERVLLGLLEALNDYKTDRRGDVGSWCRIAAMDSLTELLPLIAEVRPGDIGKLATEAVGGMLKQMSEKLDAVRKEATRCLTSITTSTVPGIALHSQLVEVIEHNDIMTEGQKWTQSSVVFPVLMQIASLRDKDNDNISNPYTESILAGMFKSIGGLTEGISKQSSDELIRWGRTGADQKERLWKFLWAELQSKCHFSTIKTLNLLLSHRIFDDILNAANGERCSTAVDSLVNILNDHACRTQDIQLILSICEVLVSLQLNAPGCRKVRCALASFLGHRYPRVRSFAAEQMYLTFVEDTDHASVVDLLLRTPWASEDHSIWNEPLEEIGRSLNMNIIPSR